jgi:hypothetical protein
MTAYAFVGAFLAGLVMLNGRASPEVYYQNDFEEKCAGRSD